MQLLDQKTIYKIHLQTEHASNDIHCFMYLSRSIYVLRGQLLSGCMITQ